MSDRSLKLFILDSDVVFAEGLTKVLSAEDDIEIIAQTRTLTQTREKLRTLTSLPDVLILDINLTEEENFSSEIESLRELKQTYPNLPLFLLTTVKEATVLRSISNLGIEGYSRKKTPPEELIKALRQVSRGELCWQQGTMLQSAPSLAPVSVSEQPDPPPNWLTLQRRTGIAEIESNLAQVEAILQKQGLSTFDWLFWSGLRRELRTARWLVKQLLPVEVVKVKVETVTTLPPTVVPSNVSDTLLQTTLGKIQLGLVNQTGYTLEIDILKSEKKQELLYSVVQELEEILKQLEFVELPPEDLPERRSILLRELWQTCLTRWMNRYVSFDQFPASNSVLDFVIRESQFVESMRLNKLPQVSALFAYLLYKQPLEVDHVSYRYESPEAQSRAEILLHHLIVEVANGVMQVILNQFGEQETVKTSLYEKPYRSSRQIARFRNELSWQYRQNYYFREPKAIFESRYELFVFRGRRIQVSSVYAPRKAELEALEGLRFWVTFALELRDSIAPRFRAIFSLVGQGVVYVLTQVIGRGIGLIGRGFLQGIGKSVESKRDR